MKINTDNIKFYALLGIILLFVIFKTCVYHPKPVTQIDIKPEIKRQDSFRTIIKYEKKERIVELIKWRTMTRIKDSVKCYTELVPFIAQCDTIIKHDSILIGTEDKALSNDSVIQKKQADIIKQKSDSIALLKKEVRNQKLQKKGIIALWILREGVGVAQKIKN